MGVVRSLVQTSDVYDRRGAFFNLVALAIIGAASLLAPVKASGQAPGDLSPVRGAVLGAGAGVAVGLGLARATDYALQEGGFFTVVVLGGALGSVHGYKLGASWGGPWKTPGRFQVSFPWGYARSTSVDDVEQAFTASGFTGHDAHHSLVPAVTVLFDLVGPLRVGAEASGIRGLSVRAAHDLGRVTESVEGRVVSALLVFGSRPSDTTRLSPSLGVGLDRYSAEALTYFDQRMGTGLPSDVAQPNRNARAQADGWGGHVRVGIEWYITYDFSFQLSAVRRWTEAIQMPGIRLLDSDGYSVLEHAPHQVAIESVRLDLGFGLRY